MYVCTDVVTGCGVGLLRFVEGTFRLSLVDI